MLYCSYTFLFLCCIQFYIVPVNLKTIPSLSLITQLQNNLIQLNSASKQEAPSPSPLLDSVHPTSVIKARILKLQKVRDDFEKEIQPTSTVQTPKQTDLAEVIEKIRSRKFTDAEVILRKMNLIDRIPEIVHNVYNNSENNIELLIEFGSDLTEIDLAYGVFSALWNEMKSNDERDVFKMISLVDSIEKRLFVLKASLEWKTKAEVLTNETITEIKQSSIEILKKAMISDNYQNNTQVKLLADSIFDLSWKHDIWDEVIQKVVIESFSEVSAVKIAQNLYSHKLLSQVISGLQGLFEKLKDSKNLNNPAILNIAEYLKNLTEMKNYANLSKQKKEDIDSIIKKMPLCARNLFFEPFVCIWNRGKSEYLYVAGPEYNRNEDKRSVFTRISGEPVGPGVWIVEKSGDEFFFRSKAYQNEYLYATSGTHDKDNRFVHTWTEGGKVGNKSSWDIELDGNDCYIRNVNYKEYLFASDRQSGDKSRYTFTWIPKTSTQELMNFKWQIRSCDLSEILKKGV